MAFAREPTAGRHRRAPLLRSGLPCPASPLRGPTGKPQPGSELSRLRQTLLGPPALVLPPCPRQPRAPAAAWPGHPGACSVWGAGAAPRRGQRSLRAPGLPATRPGPALSYLAAAPPALGPSARTLPAAESRVGARPGRGDRGGPVVTSARRGRGRGGTGGQCEAAGRAEGRLLLGATPPPACRARAQGHRRAACRQEPRPQTGLQTSASADRAEHVWTPLIPETPEGERKWDLRS